MAAERMDRWATVLVVAAAVCGLLAMHGFEAALVHADHADASGHVAGIEASGAEAHVQHGGCSLEKPDDSSGLALALCPVDAFAPATALQSSGTTSAGVAFANRAVLTAFSILRL